MSRATDSAINSAYLLGVEFGVKMSESGLNLQASIEQARRVLNGADERLAASSTEESTQ